MKRQYDFRKGERGAVVPAPPGKTRITIRLDNDILEWFRGRAHLAGGGNYQTMINTALREYVNQDIEELEDTLRRVVREELHRSAG
ncbi:MAG: BrnA antitoxin family protein [Longimicrobiales bacterium]